MSCQMFSLTAPFSHALAVSTAAVTRLRGAVRRAGAMGPCTWCSHRPVVAADPQREGVLLGRRVALAATQSVPVWCGRLA
jgi:hypothetical protein